MLKPGLIAWFEARYDCLVAEALEYHEGLESLRPAGGKGRRKRRPCQGLALRLRDFMTETLRFLYDAGGTLHEQPGGAGPANEEAAHEDLGGAPLGAGVQDFATLRSVLSTAQEQDRNRIDTLIRSLTALLDGVRR